MFRSLNITTKILVWEHNWDWPKYADSILQDSAAAQYVTGSSWHCYSGRHDEPGKFHEQHPTKDIYFTECSGTTNNNDKDIVWGFRLLMIGQMRNWARTVLLWNMALDEHDGPQVGVGDVRSVGAWLNLTRMEDSIRRLTTTSLDTCQSSFFPEQWDCIRLCMVGTIHTRLLSKIRTEVSWWSCWILGGTGMRLSMSA